MSLHIEQDDIRWYDKIEDAKADEYTPVRCWSLLQFYELRGKSSSLLRANLVPIKYLYYTVFTSSENRYYKRLSRPYDIEVLYFYRATPTFSGEDEAVENLRKYVTDKNVTLLFTQPQIEATQKMLEKVFKANVSTEGKLSYVDYIAILDLSLKIEDYKDIGKNLTGYRTALAQMEQQLREFWKKVANPQK